LPLLGEISVIQIFVYKQAWTDHVFWVSALLLILTRGPGIFSLDYLIDRYFAQRSLRKGMLIASSPPNKA